MSELELMPCQCGEHPVIKESLFEAFCECTECGIRSKHSKYLVGGDGVVSIDTTVKFWNELQTKLAAFKRASAVLSEHQSEIDWLRQNVDRITPMNTEADPKMLRLLIALADMLEAE